MAFVAPLARAGAQELEKITENLIKQIANEILGKLIEEIEQLITNDKDVPVREKFTQGNLGPAAALVNKPVNVMIFFNHVKHDDSDLLAKGWKKGTIYCKCPAAGNTLIYNCYIGDKAATFHNKGDGGYRNWAFSGTFNRHDGDVSFADV